jgi:hypothetical protein
MHPSTRTPHWENDTMPKLDANLQWMFTEYEVLDRYDAAAAAAGFRGVELQAPYALPLNDIVERLENNHLTHVIINLPNADPDSGEGNIGLNPTRKALFRERLQMATDYAAELGCLGVNTGVGVLPAGVDPDVAWQTLIENLHLAADVLGAVGVKALVEAINNLRSARFLGAYDGAGETCDRRGGAPEYRPPVRLRSHADDGGKSIADRTGQPRPHLAHAIGGYPRPPRTWHGGD